MQQLHRCLIPSCQCSGRLQHKSCFNNHLMPFAEEALYKSQCGFHPQHDMLTWSLLFNSSKRSVKNKPFYFYLTPSDLTKAFEPVDHETLWKIIHILCLLHRSMKVSVLSNGIKTDPFEVKTGVKQGYIIAPALNILVFLGCHPTIYGRKSTALCTKTSNHLNGKNSSLPVYGQRPKCKQLSVVKLQYMDNTAAVCSTKKEHFRHLCDGLRETRSLTIKANQRPKF